MNTTETTRTTTAVVDQVAASGRVFVHEVSTGRPGYLANNTPTQGLSQIQPGQSLRVEVQDSGDVMIVISASAA